MFFKPKSPDLTLQDEILIPSTGETLPLGIAIDTHIEEVKLKYDGGEIYLDRQAKIYLSSKTRPDKRFLSGMVDDGCRDRDIDIYPMMERRHTEEIFT